MKRVSAFSKRVLQLALCASPAWACGALFLVSELLKVKPALWPAVQQPEEADAAAAEVFHDVVASDRYGCVLGGGGGGKQTDGGCPYVCVGQDN